MTDTNDPVPGYPDVAKLGRLPDDVGKRYAHYNLHIGDLRFALAFLDEFDRRREAGDQPHSITSTALWHAALNSTMKCFGPSNARERLHPADVFGETGTTTERDAFDYLNHLRNKNISHDDNDWTQVVPYVMIAKRSVGPKVFRVDCSGLHAVSSSTANIARLRTVINKALEWATTNYEQQAESIRAELESWDYDALLALPAVTHSIPTDTSVGTTRNTPGR